MQPEDMILVSVDDHLVEPPNLFEGAQRRARRSGTFNGHHDVEIRSFDHGQFQHRGCVPRIGQREIQCLTDPRCA